MEHLAYEYGVVKSAVHGAMVWVENTLIREGTFRLPGKNALVTGENKLQTILIDVTESPIERYRNRRRRHKLRMTLLCAIRNYEIIDNAGERTGLFSFKTEKNILLLNSRRENCYYFKNAPIHVF